MTRNVATWPNLVTLLRLLCLPLFLWLLFTRDDRAAAAYLLGVLGATDWIDGWLARKLQQRSEFGAVFDPAVDRLLFIVGVGAIIVDGS
ncbi:MAG: CDP-alcohol phosphatidyltransferase family protein, partial [Actinobacteria bacterium]|nr:CDP-alcohol phosphatidyltransferase family protein [Actinomycetota bacterium]